MRDVELTGTNTPRPYSHFPLNFFPHFCVVVRKSRFEISGGHSGGATPGSMPNPDVKPSSAHGTAEAICGRVGRRQGSFFMPSKHLKTPQIAFENPGYSINSIKTTQKSDLITLPKTKGVAEIFKVAHGDRDVCACGT